MFGRPPLNSSQAFANSAFLAAAADTSAFTLSGMTLAASRAPSKFPLSKLSFAALIVSSTLLA